MVEESTVGAVQERLRQAGRDVATRVEGNGISIYAADGRPVARLRFLGESGWEVRRPTATSWTHIGDFGGEAYEQLDDAVAYLLEDPAGVLWRDGGSR